MQDAWDSGEPYERFMGRWSLLLGAAFVDWLAAPEDLHWLDVGCGSGALGETIAARRRPARLVALDRSAQFVDAARRRLGGRAECLAGDALDLPLPDAGFDIAVSALVLNFVPDPVRMLAEMRRVTRPGGTVAVYVWDYAGTMEFLSRFWDAAVELDPGAAGLHEGRRFPAANADGLAGQFDRAGLDAIAVEPLTIETRFASFDDYWSPFLGGQGPAGTYAAGLDEARQTALRERLRAGLDAGPDGSIALAARAWCARGTR